MSDKIQIIFLLNNHGLKKTGEQKSDPQYF